MSSSGNNLILSLDDFGISQEANKRILSLIRDVKVDRVSIMVNGILIPAEIKTLLDSGVKLDIHFDFQKILTKNRKLKEGILRRSLIFAIKYLSGTYNPKLLEQEWIKQMQKFQELFGKKPDGISSHQYIHFLPAYFKIILKLSEQFDVRYIRFGAKGMVKSKSHVFKILSWLRKIDEPLFSRSSLVSSDFLVSLDWISDLKSFVKGCSEGTTEVIGHPEREDEFLLIKKYF